MGKRVLEVKKPSLKAKLLMARDMVREYVDLNAKIRIWEKRKKEIQGYCLDLLDEMDRKNLETDGIRWQKVTTTKAKYDVKKLLALFYSKGLKAEARKIFKISVDDDELARVIEDGKVTLDEIKNLSEIRETFHFRADYLVEKNDEDVPF